MPDLEYYRNLAAELKAAKTEESRDEAVGRKTISNLFFDENSMLEYLAEQRFPGDPTAPLRYSYVDGDLVYEDENGNLVPEFGALEDASMIEEYLIPNIVPRHHPCRRYHWRNYWCRKRFCQGRSVGG
jgi:hypothetical protein